MTVTAVVGAHVVIGLEHRHDADGDGLLPAVQVEEAGHLALQELLVRGLLEGADAHHRPVEIEEGVFVYGLLCRHTDLPSGNCVNIALVSQSTTI